MKTLSPPELLLWPLTIAYQTGDDFKLKVALPFQSGPEDWQDGVGLGGHTALQRTQFSSQNPV